MKKVSSFLNILRHLISFLLFVFSLGTHPGPLGPLFDIALIVDGSSESRRDLNEIQNFLKLFVSGIGVSKDGVHVGIVEYGNTARIALAFNWLNDKRLVHAFIDSLRPTGGSPRLDRALSKTRELFTVERGSRPGVNKIAVLIANSKYRGRDSDLQQALRELRESGVRVYVISSDKPDASRLRTLSTTGTTTIVVRFEEAEEIVTRTVQTIKDEDKGTEFILRLG